MTTSRPSIDDLVAGVKASDRAILARAITLIESTRADLERVRAERDVRQGGTWLRGDPSGRAPVDVDDRHGAPRGRRANGGSALRVATEPPAGLLRQRGFRAGGERRLR